jgi:hypothetical protein
MTHPDRRQHPWVLPVPAVPRGADLLRQQRAAAGPGRCQPFQAPRTVQLRALAPPTPPLAPHVAAAIQAKPANGPARPVAAHVQAALQRKPAPAPSRPTAPHVQAVFQARPAPAPHRAPVPAPPWGGRPQLVQLMEVNRRPLSGFAGVGTHTLAVVGFSSAQARPVGDERKRIHQWSAQVNYGSLAVNGQTYIRESAGDRLHSEVLLICQAAIVLGAPQEIHKDATALFQYFKTTQRGPAVLYTERIPCTNQGIAGKGCREDLKLALKGGDQAFYTCTTNVELQELLTAAEQEAEEAELMDLLPAPEELEADFQRHLFEQSDAGIAARIESRYYSDLLERTCAQIPEYRGFAHFNGDLNAYAAHVDKIRQDYNL